MSTRRSPDRTTRIARNDVRAAMARSVPPVFVWPAPPYYEYAAPDRARADSECLLVFSDGTRSVGNVVEFRPDEAMLRYRQKGAVAPVQVAFTSLLRMELHVPVEVRRQQLPAGMDARVFAASDRKPFTLRLANGGVLSGDTVGNIEALCGIFLFLPEEDNGVVRQFVPTHVIRAFTLDTAPGETSGTRTPAPAAPSDADLTQQTSFRNRRFSDALADSGIVTTEQLAEAIRRQHSQPARKLGEVLVELGHLSADDLEDALAIEERNRLLPLGQILSDMGVVEPDVVNSVMAKKLGIPFVKLRNFEITNAVLKRIPAGIAHRFVMMPIAEADNALVVALDNPANVNKLEELRFIAGSRVAPVLASTQDIRDALKRHYGVPEGGGMPAERAERRGGTAALPLWGSANAEVPVEELAARLVMESAEIDLNERHAAQSDTTLVKLVNKIILDAVEQKASDIHIEANPGNKGTRVRFRKDGGMVTYLQLPANFRRAVISRLKIMSQLDITERRRPQDGKIDFSQFGDAKVELRVATIPTTNGLEDVVMRVLAAATPVPIEQVGFDPAMLATITRLISRPHGLFLVCGPTGAGKTTTLHSLLGHVNTDDRKIWTAEDPIEIAQPGLRQVQVNAKIGWTFAAAMRSFMRADPDIIMVGEMRDAETAKIGIEASLTGHLVLSTLHTNSAVESVVRLLDLGADPFNFADALLGVLSQRLVRRLCAACRAAHAPAEGELEALASEYGAGTPEQAAALLQRWRAAPGEGGIRLFEARGCERCDGTGYKGRMGVYELLVADADLRRLIQQRAPISALLATAVAAGMRTLKQDGIEKVVQGHTDLAQVRSI